MTNYVIMILLIIILALYLDQKISRCKIMNYVSSKNFVTRQEFIKLEDNFIEFEEMVDQEIFDTIDVEMEPIDLIKFYKLPEKGSRYAAGYDIYWSTVNKDLNEDGSVTINPGETLIFGTNLKIMIPIDNFYLDICSRSGMSINKNLVVVNSPARIDSDYRGELLVGLKNISNIPAVIEPQSRIAQCTLHREINTNFIFAKVINNTERGEGGLGHSG